MSRYEKTSKGTVIDHETGLEWQHDYFEWLLLDDDMGEKYARSQDTGGYDDWRVPVIEELITLIDYSRCRPTSTFPGMPSRCFLSSSVDAFSDRYAWGVSFGSGYVNHLVKDGSYLVRCVRRGPLKQQRFDAEERNAELEAEVARLRRGAHRRTREDHLRAQGFDDPGDDQRRDQLAKNVALKDWPFEDGSAKGGAMSDTMIKRVLKRLDGPPTQDEIAAARNVLERLVAHGDLDPSDVRRAQDGLRVIAEAYWRAEEEG